MKLEVAASDSEPIGLRQHVGDAPDVMGAERRVHYLLIFEQSQRELFKTRIRLGLLRKNRNRPVALLSNDGFIIPVGSFDEAHGDPALELPRPIDDAAEVAFTIAQISLEGEAACRGFGEFCLGKYLFKESQC